MATVAEPGTANGRVKLGLALSGGGFRASFFHVGVLAQMAMQGLLRRVEVISTVSGGSIIGALYYLHLKRLLESDADSDLTDGRYQQMVEDIERDFFAAVQTNLRMSTFTDPAANFKIRRPDYSRSDRIAELYNDRLYQGVLPGLEPPIKIREVKIQPKGADPAFHPERDNHGRSAKVPILLVNATTLNSGRNWRFTASRMGEPPRDNALAREIDKKAIRLRRPLSYTDIPPYQQDFTLGHAVAASACVPGIFHPLAISGLYRDPETEDEIRVQLVDGGIHDNQGIQGLLDEACTHIIVSDASAQMEEIHEPATHFDAVLGRAASISQDRVREEQLFRLWGPTDRSRIAFMHLRAGLTTRAIAWLGPDGQPADPSQEFLRPAISAADFHVDDRVQDLVSGIRTDLRFLHRGRGLHAHGGRVPDERLRVPQQPGCGDGRPAGPKARGSGATCVGLPQNEALDGTAQRGLSQATQSGVLSISQAIPLAPARLGKGGVSGARPPNASRARLDPDRCEVLPGPYLADGDNVGAESLQPKARPRRVGIPRAARTRGGHRPLDHESPHPDARVLGHKLTSQVHRSHLLALRPDRAFAPAGALECFEILQQFPFVAVTERHAIVMAGITITRQPCI